MHLQGFNEPPRDADWSEVTSSKALAALREVQKYYKGGKLVKLGNDYAWAFRNKGRWNFAASNDDGEIMPHIAA